jgi:hypothetical protein
MKNFISFSNGSQYGEGTAAVNMKINILLACNVLEWILKIAKT